MRKLECPGCGANLTLKDDDREFAFCEFCGAKIMLDDYRSTHRVVDEAKLKQAETEQLVRIKELELEEKKAEEERETKKSKFSISIILGVVGLICMVIGGDAYLVGMVCFCVLLYMWI